MSHRPVRGRGLSIYISNGILQVILTIDSHSMKVAQDRTLIHFLPLIGQRGLRSNYR